MGATSRSFDSLFDEALSYPLQGWDWGFVAGRYHEAAPPWDYRAEVMTLLPGAHALLDMGTGGGEFLIELAPLPPDTWATEAYAPNVPLARAALAPYGVKLVAVEDDAQLPLPDAYFDLVINRHESFDAAEIARILKPGGYFLTQQVGGRDMVELNEALQDEVSLNYEDWSLATAVAQLGAAGLTMLEEREDVGAGRFDDIGAVVWYLRVAPWQVEGFDIVQGRAQLQVLHERMVADGGLHTSIHRFLVLAQKPGHV
jgi:SAM-dependent methyltransferase